MAGPYTTGKGFGQLWFRPETALNVSAATWDMLRPEEPPTIKTIPRHTIEVSRVGHRNPFDTGDLPVLAPATLQADAVGLKMAAYQSAAGVIPGIVQLFMSSGMSLYRADQAANTKVVADTTAGVPTVSAIEATTGSVTTWNYGNAHLIELPDGRYWPTLIASVGTKIAVPSMRLPVAPAAAADIIQMYSFSPRTNTTYEVDATRLPSLQFKWHGWGKYKDAFGDHTLYRTACRPAGIGEITVAPFGNKFLFDFSFFGLETNMVDDDDMVADDFLDLGVPLIMNDDFEFGIAAANAAGDLVRTTRPVKDLKINLGLTLTPTPYQGGGSVGGAQTYHLQWEPATITFTAGFDTSYKAALDEFVGSNTAQYIHLVQPTRAPTTTPAIGFWMPKCHLAPGEPITVTPMGDIVEYTATYRADMAGYNSGEADIEDAGAIPFVIAFSGTPAA